MHMKQDIYYNDSGELVIFTYRVSTEKEAKKFLEKLFPPEEKTTEDAKACIPQPVPDWLRTGKEHQLTTSQK